MKKLLALVLCISMMVGIVGCAGAEEFTLRNGIKFGDTKADVRAAMKGDKAMKQLKASDFDSSSRVEIPSDSFDYIGSLLGSTPSRNFYYAFKYRLTYFGEEKIGNMTQYFHVTYNSNTQNGVALTFEFDNAGKLTKMRYAFKDTANLSPDAKRLWEGDMYKSIVEKYGEPINSFSKDKWDGKTEGTVSIYGDSSMRAYSARMKADKLDEIQISEWLVKCDGGAVKIESVHTGENPFPDHTNHCDGLWTLDYIFIPQDKLQKYEDNADATNAVLNPAAPVGEI